MRPSLKIMTFLIPLIFAVLTESAYAWGERGHDVVTRVAVRILMEKEAKGATLSPVFLEKANMMAHFSNVPDIVWRSGPKEMTDLNAPTHFVDLEYLVSSVAIEKMPRTVEAAEASMQHLCKTAPKGYVCPTKGGEKPAVSLAGTAPFRIQQLYELLESSFAAIAKPVAATSMERLIEDRMGEALLYAGLLSHFVGDLGNPHHTTRDYNGWEIDQGGIHSYFESEVVDALPLSLAQEALDYALAKKPFETRVANRLKPEDKSRPLMIAFALTVDSHSRKKDLNAIDKEHALLQPSSLEKGMKIYAKRKAAAKVAPKFKTLVIERIATAADTLAALWRMAYQQGGRPDVSSYRSYDYPVAPAFLRPDYVGSSE